MSFEKAVKAKPNARDKGNLFYKRIEVMSDKQEVNCIFAVHFDDINDPRYKAITEIMMGGDMWVKRNLVYAEHLDSRDELCAQIEKLEYKDE